MTEIAETIFKQINGNTFCRMVGATNLTYTENSLAMRFKMCSKFNHLTITLNGLDTYDVRFVKIWGINLKNDTTITGVYFDQLLDLFETQTGLATRMPQVVGINC